MPDQPMDDAESEAVAVTRLRTDYPFLTYLQYGSQGILGIMQNETSQVIMMYDLTGIRDPGSKQQFLRYGEEWWWGSNAELPIESFIGRRFDLFRPILRGYIKKEVISIIGPRVNLSESFNRRIKKKRVDSAAPLPEAQALPAVPAAGSEP